MAGAYFISPAAIQDYFANGFLRLSVPTIIDPNFDSEPLVLWETGAIIEYLIENYDKDHKISYTTKRERYLTSQWLYFQASGQGPYFGYVFLPRVAATVDIDSTTY